MNSSRLATALAAFLVLALPAAAQDVELYGFADFGVGARVVADALQPGDLLLNEARFQLGLAHYGDRAELAVKTDFTADGVADRVHVEVRQATMGLRATDWLDVRAGRQVLTWGTGDLVFLNDLFPKDFVSFFIGREDEYLKAPQNALRLTFYSPLANLDVVATPVFEPDRSITGERISYFDPMSGQLVSASSSVLQQPTRPTQTLGNGELAWRLFRTVAGYELALYGYAGFTKQPTALEAPGGPPRHLRLNVYGASVRGSVAGGIAHAETAYHDGADDEGDAPLVANSQWRGLAGYERELLPDLTGGIQYYAEHTVDHDRLMAASPAPQLEPSETRHLVTTRLTYRLLQQTLTASLFAFASPNDGDAHLRPSISYEWSDALRLTGGANVMLGDDATFFGQLQRATNVYLRARYSF
ncbi:MAG TPA: porin [Longimicrobiales bacterium]|nr:porin [Longimicrobiales bacterium]